jgi:hypothetical protein
MAYYSWDQGLVDTVKATFPYMLWMFYFYLLRKKVSINIIENIILTYGIFYVILYAIQFIYSDTVLFGYKEQFWENRGITRIIFPGGNIFYLAIFIAINRLISEKQNKLFWTLYTLIGIIIPILQVTRQFIFATLLIYFIHFGRNLNIYKKIVFIFIFIGSFIYVTNLENPIVKGIREMNKETIQEGRQYIRILAGEYFLFDYSPNYVSRLLGNGVPYVGNTKYGNYVLNLQERRFFYLSDVGIIAVYVMFGLLAILGYVLLWYKSFSYRLPKQYLYPKYYLWFLLITSFTSDSLYAVQSVIASVFAIYIYHTVYIYYNSKTNYVVR